MQLKQPRYNLIKFVVAAVVESKASTKSDYLSILKTRAIVIEDNEIPVECAIWDWENEQFFVFLKPDTDEAAIIELLAKVLLQHLKYFDSYSDSVLAEEVAFFKEELLSA